MSGQPEGFLLEDVSVRRGQARLLDHVSTHLLAGLCTAVVGPSGAGKSTLLRLLNRLDEPTTGQVLLDGVPVTDGDVLALRRRVGLVGQRPVLLTDRIADDLRVGRPDLSDPHAVELLARVGLPPEFTGRLTSGLSGGEAQRVCLARALALEPDVLLLDEPTSALDASNTALIADLARAHASTGGTVILASHDSTIVRETADWVLVLDHGRLVTTGRPNEINYLRARS
jgi:putative ABC transport system ATP-binding protein